MEAVDLSQYHVELANKIYKGRAVGNLYLVRQTVANVNKTFATFDTREEADAWIERKKREGVA